MSRQRYSAVTLDLVGTLAIFDPPEYIISRFAARKGVHVTPEEARRAIRSVHVERRGRNPREYYIALNQAVLSALHVPGTGEELLRYWFNPENYRVEACVADALQALRGRGVKLAVISNNLSWEVESLLAHTGLRSLFDAISTPDLSGAFKPSPKAFLYALEALHVAPPASLHAGDSLEEDYLAARAAGMSAVLVSQRCPQGATCIRSVCLLPEVVLDGMGGGP